MLNEERVKYMTKLAFYETKSGGEDLKVGFRYKKDYIRSNIFWAGLWTTIAYVAFSAIVWITFLGELCQTWQTIWKVLIALVFVAIYILLLIPYIRYAGRIYKGQHARAYHRVKKFAEELEHLEQLYDKEDGNE